jgi:D-alanyl-lipoteichoic acid acyltransferase DltB (MBOAT superfamily)
MLELFFLIGHLLWGAAELLNVIIVTLDGIAWAKSKANRRQRRVAKRSGKKPPKPNPWTWVMWVLTPIAAVLLAMVIWKWTA